MDLVRIHWIILLFFFKVGNEIRIVKHLEVQRFFGSGMMVMPDDITNLFDQLFFGTQLDHD